MNDTYPFVNTPLPYAYNALEPYIDTTMPAARILRSGKKVKGFAGLRMQIVSCTEKFASANLPVSA